MITASKLGKMLVDKADWLRERGTVLTENIARSDIPGETSREISKFERLVRSRQTSATGENRIRIRSRDIVNTKQEIRREWEVAKKTENDMEFQTAMNTLIHYFKLFKTVLGKSGG